MAPSLPHPLSPFPPQQARFHGLSGFTAPLTNLCRVYSYYAIKKIYTDVPMMFFLTNDLKGKPFGNEIVF